MDIDYSIIIPAFNEEEELGKTLDGIKAAMETQVLRGELIVTDNNSTDKTAEIARRAGATVVFEAVNQISRARNAGAAVARGRNLIFVDADTHIVPELLQQALDSLESGECFGGGATIEMEGELNFPARSAAGLWNFVSRTFGLAAGCFIYVPREDFKACGGFSEKVYATEELWFVMALKRRASGSRRKFIVIDRPRAHTSGRKLVWYRTSFQLVLMAAVCAFPLLSRFKWMCSFWYKRPEG